MPLPSFVTTNKMGSICATVEIGQKLIFTKNKNQLGLRKHSKYSWHHNMVYNEITLHFAMGRRVFPPLARKLNRAQALTLRLLQTETYPNPAFLHKLYPDVYLTISCTKCGGLATLHHMLWECPSVRGTDTASASKWGSALRSPDIQSQLWAVQRAHDAAVGLGLTVPSWERPAVC